MTYPKIAAAVLAAALAAPALADDVKPVTYKPADGFTFQTVDDNFKLTLGGRLQPNFSYTSKDNQPELAQGSGDVATFRIRRAYLWFKGNAFSKDVTYKLQVDFAANPSLLDAWINYRYMDELQVEGGQDITPFARQELNSSASLQFIERSIVVDYFKPSYDMGAMVWGKVAGGLFYYNVGAFNGMGANVRRTSSNLAYNFRAVVNPLGDMAYAESDVDGTPSPKLSIGASYYMTKLARGTPQDASTANYFTGFLAPLVANGVPVAPAVSDVIETGLFEVDAAFKWMGLYAQAEYFMGAAKAKNALNAADGLFGNAGEKKKLDATGFYGQAGYMVLPSTLEVALRYSWLNPNTTSWTSATNVASKHDERTEMAAAVNYYAKKNGLKLQATVEQIGREERSTTAGATTLDYVKLKDMAVRVQAQIIF